MKKGQLIHTDNLILRIIVTFLGTFGAASIIETITYPLADMGFIGFVSLIFSVVYTFMLSCYGKNARLIRIMGMAVLPVVYLVINNGRECWCGFCKMRMCGCCYDYSSPCSFGS